jgi:gamma-glutamyltranspeptidase
LERATEDAGGLMRASDLAEFHAEIEQPQMSSFHGLGLQNRLRGQGPVARRRSICESYDLKKLGHNFAGLHTR